MRKNGKKGSEQMTATEFKIIVALLIIIIGLLLHVTLKNRIGIKKADTILIGILICLFVPIWIILLGIAFYLLIKTYRFIYKAIDKKYKQWKRK